MKVNKSTLIHNIIFIFIILVFAILLIFFSSPFERSSKPTVQTDVAPEYIIGVYHDKIAVFTQEDKLPIEIFDVYVSTLPDFDQKELLRGIKVKGKVELKRRIEDYTS